MHIIVCIKQVPGSNRVEVDPVTGVLKRDGVESKLNPYDLFALETAFRIREKRDAEAAEEKGEEKEKTRITVLSMGPPQAVSSLREAVWMGADGGLLLSDRKFAGADVQATSYALSRGVAKLGKFDLILCGRQTTDGDTAQVGPELAETLGIEHAACVVSVDEVTEDSVTVTISLEDRFQKQKMALPCLLTIDRDAFTPRLPSYKVRKSCTGEEITVCSAAELEGVDESRLGLSGSPTRVERIFPPERNAEKRVREGTGAELSEALASLLSERKFL